MKFGGTSLGDKDKILNCANLVKSNLDLKPIIVVSAMGGVTNLLIKTAKMASQGDKDIITKNISTLIDLHETVIKDLKNPGNAHYLVNCLIDSLKTLYESILILGELTSRSLDLIISYGERLSSLVFTLILKDLNLESEQIMTNSLIITDSTFGNAVVNLELTKPLVQNKISRSLNAGKVPVITGFIGGNEQGTITTIGRSGSDYTASIVGASMGAREVWIWTDVDGVMTADPRIVKNAKTIPELSYPEASELAYFGAGVIHPKTMLPTVEYGIPIRIKNTFNPTHPGSLIVSKCQNRKLIQGITSITNLSLLNVEGAGMMGVPGIAAQVFQTIAALGVNVLMISQASSEHSICFVVHQDSADKTILGLRKKFEEHMILRNIDKITKKDNISIVSIVGSGMVGTIGVSAKLFGCLGKNDVNVIAIAQGSSELSISFVIHSKDLKSAVCSIHNEFDL
jgi:bifunctional aspartokinase / homoserine dehydrogenase 1